MKPKAAFFLTFLLFFSFFNAANAALIEEARMNIGQESKFSAEQSVDDFEMYADVVTVFKVSFSPILHVSRAPVYETPASDIFKPPKSSRYIS